MSKIATIATSEYVRKLKSKAFLLGTILAPVLMVGMFGIVFGIGVMSQESDQRTFAVLDETGRLGEDLIEALPERYTVVASDMPEDSLRARVLRGSLDGFFLLPEGLIEAEEEALLMASRGGGFSGNMLLQEVLNGVVREARLRDMGVDEEVFTALEQRVRLRSVVLTETGDAADASWLYTVLGYVIGFAIYIAMFTYGAMVMRGVIEEKSNRIVEIIASSARPFELMMGKVLGIGAAGLTQFAVWGLLLMAGFAFLGPIVMATSSPDMAAGPEADAALEAAGVTEMMLPSPWIFLYALLYFLGGYLLYASLFAAVGSAVENESDAQSLQIPITIPVVMPALFLPFIADNPESTVSIVLSIFPFFSPILMPVRIAAEAAAGWEIALSLVLLAATFVGAIWLAARIYRVGILMYGKKAGFRDMLRWVRYA